MAELTDPVRELMRRAYRADEDVDLTAGLLDVVRRAEPPATEILVPRPALQPPHPVVPTRRRSGLAMVAAFAAAIIVVVGIAVLTARSPQSPGTVTGSPRPSGVPSGVPSGFPSGGTTPKTSATAPKALPSSCASEWKLTLSGREFGVISGNPTCPALHLDRLWFVDVASGNGLINEGDATVWRITPAGGARPMVQAPFTFTVDGWPGPVAGHFYEVWYTTSAPASARSGDDATVIYEDSYGVSLSLSYP